MNLLELMSPWAKATLGTPARARLVSENPRISPHTLLATSFLCYLNVQLRCSQPCSLEGRPPGACTDERVDEPYRRGGQSGFPATTRARPTCYAGEGKTGWIGPSSVGTGGPFLVRPLQGSLTEEAGTSAGGTFSFPSWWVGWVYRELLLPRRPCRLAE